MSKLGDFLLRCGARRREPGVFDCACFPAEWAMLLGHPDPMEQWRGAYATESEAADVIASAGGLAALFRTGLGSVGIPEADGEPRPGDIAVIDLCGEQAGAIFTGRRWAFVAERGIVAASIEPGHIVQSWRP